MTAHPMPESSARGEIHCLTPEAQSRFFHPPGPVVPTSRNPSEHSFDHTFGTIRMEPCGRPLLFDRKRNFRLL